MSTRIYKVTQITEPEATTLVEASTAQQALRTITAPLFSVKVATGVEIAAMMSRGAVVKKALQDTVETHPELPEASA